MKYLGLIIALCVPFLSSCERLKEAQEKKKKSEQAMRDFENSANEMREEMVKDFESTGEINHNPEAMDRAIQNLRKAEKNLSADQAAMARVSASLMESFNREASMIQSKGQQLMSVADYSAVRSVEDLKAKRRIVEDYIKMNDDLMKRYKDGLRTEIQAALDKEKVSKKDQTAFFQGVNETLTPRIPHIIIVREADDEICKLLLKQLDILEKGYGNWTLQDGQLLFGSDSDLTAYNALQVKMEASAAKQAQAQQSLMQQMKQR